MRAFTVLSIALALLCVGVATTEAVKPWWANGCKRFGALRVLIMAVKHTVPTDVENPDLTRNSFLYQIDSDTHAATEIGLIKAMDGVALYQVVVAFDDLSGRLFGTGIRPAASNANGRPQRVIVEIDITTAQATYEVVASLTGYPEETFENENFIDAIFTADGHLYLTTNGGSYWNVRRVNVDTGIFDSLAVDLSVFGSFPFGFGLTTDAEDNIHLWASNFNIDASGSIVFDRSAEGIVTVDSASAFPMATGSINPASITPVALTNLPATCSFPRVSSADVIVRGVPFFKEARGIVRCDYSGFPEAAYQDSCFAVIFPERDGNPRRATCVSQLSGSQGSWASVAMRRVRHCFAWF